MSLIEKKQKPTFSFPITGFLFIVIQNNTSEKTAIILESKEKKKVTKHEN